MQKELVLTPIGVIHTPYTYRYAAPRQPRADDRSAEGLVVLNKGMNFEQALDDLAGMEKIWLVYQFDRNPNWNPKVQTPRGKGKRGVFATRSPHRPNPIGLSLVDLLEVKGLELRVGNVDLLDGTPILDIKPYLPYAEAFPNAKAGWLDEIPENIFEVEWDAKTLEETQAIEKREGVDLILHAERVLSTDPEPHAYRRIKKAEDGSFIFAHKYWRLYFRLEGNKISITGVSDAREEN